jgi:hypothetical protein
MLATRKAPLKTRKRAPNDQSSSVVGALKIVIIESSVMLNVFYVLSAMMGIVIIFFKCDNK